jgi:Mg2+ and Co2+ transporter CorA
VKYFEGMFSAMIALLWWRFVLFLRLNKLLGPFIVIISNMLNDVLVFLTIYSVFLLSSAGIFSIVMQKTEVKVFNGYYRSFITLFSASLGVFDFKVIEGNYLA